MNTCEHPTRKLRPTISPEPDLYEAWSCAACGDPRAAIRLRPPSEPRQSELPGLSTKQARALTRAQTEKLDGIDVDDPAGRWLAAHDHPNGRRP